MNSENLFRISKKQYFFILCISSLSMEYLLLPNLLSERSNSYIVAPLIFLLVFKLFLWFLLWGALRKYEGMTLLEIIKLKYGKVIGNIITAIYSTYLIFVQLILLLGIVSLIKQDMLYLTPNSIIIFFILMLVLYGLMNGITVISRISELIFCLIIFLVLFSLILFKKVEYTNYFPILNADYKNFILTGYFIASLFSGLECAGIYNKYLKREDNSLKTGIGVILVTELILIIYTFITYGTLGKEIILKMEFPVIRVISLMGIPIVNREEIIFSFISLLIAIVALIIYSYSTTIIISNTFKDIDNRKTMLINISIIVVLGFLSLVLGRTVQWQDLLKYKQVFPVLLLCIIVLSYKKNIKKVKGGKVFEKK